MTATDGTGDTNLTYPFNQFSADIIFDGANPLTTETITIGSKVYRFIATPAQANDVDIGADEAVTANNLRQALLDGNLLYDEGTHAATTYHDDTVRNTDILHAELGHSSAGGTIAVLHITATSAIAVTTAATNVTIEDQGGNTITTTVHHDCGDYIELKSESAEADSTKTTVTCLHPAAFSGTAAADTGIRLSNHAGVGLPSLGWDAGAGLPGLAPIHTTGGIAGKLTGATANAGFYVFYH